VSWFGKVPNTIADLLHTWKMRSPSFHQAPKFLIIKKKKSLSCMQTELTRLLINKSRAPNRTGFVVEMPLEFFRSVKVRPDTLQYLCKDFEVQENVPPTKLKLGQ
jgi:hypothetical protein